MFTRIRIKHQAYRYVITTGCHPEKKVAFVMYNTYLEGEDNFPNSVFFSTIKTTIDKWLTPKSRKTTVEIAKILYSLGLRVSIVGSSNETKLKGSWQDEWVLEQVVEKRFIGPLRQQLVADLTEQAKRLQEEGYTLVNVS